MVRAAALALVLVFAGCLAGPGGSSGLSGFDESGGLLRGIVTDDELLPVSGAVVQLDGPDRTVTTDEGGYFELDAVPPGEWTLNVQAPGHASANETVSVQEGAAVELQLRLPKLAIATPRAVPFLFKGHYDCAHEVPTWPGDCMLLYRSATGQNDTLTDETFHFRLPIEAGWESVVVELVWTQAPNNQLDGMRVYLENANGTADGHSYKVGRADGNANPLRVVVHRGEPHPRADTYTDTKTPAFIPDEGERAQIRVFPRGHLYGTTSQVCGSDGRCFLGVGAGLSIDFKVYATVFYHERAPASFSGIPDQ